jgi:hypothetical protein
MAFPKREFTEKPQKIMSSYNPPHNPKVFHDVAKTKELFNRVRTGDIDTVRNYVMENRLTYSNMFDQDGSSLLHALVDQEGVTDIGENKVKLAEFLISNGVSVTSPNKLSLTPIHLATRLQNVRLVNLFIKSGANVNVVDNQMMTPLHYAVRGNVKRCGGKKIVGSIVPEEPDEKMIHVKPIKELIDSIIHTWSNDAEIQRNIRLLNDRFRNFDTYFKKETDEVEKKYLNEKLPNLLSKYDTNEAGILQRVENLLDDFRKELYSQVYQQYVGAFERVDPEADIQGNKVMYQGLDALTHIDENIKKIEDEKKQKKDDVVQSIDFDTVLDNNIKIVENFKTEIDKLDSLNNSLTQLAGVKITLNFLDTTLKEVLNSFQTLRLVVTDELAEKYSILQFETKFSKNDIPDNIFTRNGLVFTIYKKIINNLIMINNRLKLLKDNQLVKLNNELPQAKISALSFLNKNRNYWDRKINEWENRFDNGDHYIDKKALFDLLAHLHDINILSDNEYLKVLNKLPISIARVQDSLDDLVNNRKMDQKVRDTILDPNAKSSVAFTTLGEFQEKVVNPIINRNILTEKEIELINELLINQISRGFATARIEDDIDYRDEKGNEGFFPWLRSVFRHIFTIVSDTIKESDKFIKSKKSLSQLDNIPKSNNLIYDGLKNYVLIFNSLIDSYNQYYKQLILRRYIDRSNTFPPLIYDINRPTLGININSVPKRRIPPFNPLPNILGNNLVNLPLIDDKSGKEIPDPTNPNPFLINTPKTAEPLYKDQNGDYINLLEDPGNNKNLDVKVNLPVLAGSFPELLKQLKKNILNKSLSVYRTDIQSQIDTKHGRAPPPQQKIDPEIDKVVKNLETMIKQTYHVKIQDQPQDTKLVMDIIQKTIESLLTEYFTYILHFSTTEYVNNKVEVHTKNNNYRDMFHAKNSSGEPIFRFETPVRLNLQKVIENIVEPYKKAYDPNLKLDQLHYSSSIVKDPNEKKEQKGGRKQRGKLQSGGGTNGETSEHPLYNLNYFSDIPFSEQKCYVIKPEIILALLNANAKINERDVDGNLPLHYAIDIQHLPSIRILLKKQSAFLGDRFRNKVGYNPYEHGVKLLKMHNNVLYDIKPSVMIKKFSDPYNKIVFDELRGKIEYKNNVPMYADQMMSQVFVMFNQYINLLAQRRLRGWTFDKHKKLIEVLDKYKIISSSGFPIKQFSILNLTDDEIKAVINAGDDLHVLNKVNTDIQKEEGQLKEEQKELVQRSQSYQEEQKNVKDDVQKKGLEEKIKDVSKERTEHLDTRIKLRSQTNNMTRYIDQSTKNESKDIKNKIDILTKTPANFGNVKSTETLYENISKNVSNSNSYNKLWSLYLQDNKRLLSFENIPLLINQCIHRMLDTLQKHDVAKRETLEDLKVLVEFHKSIVHPTLDDYRNLPMFLKKDNNYILQEIFKIIVHTTSNVLGNALYLSVIKYLTVVINEQFVVPENKKEEKVSYIKNVIDRILNTPYQNTTLKEYIKKDLNKGMVKNVLQLYDDDDDQDKKLDQDYYMTNISKRLSSNSVFPIKPDGIMIKNMTNYVYPYFKDLYVMFVKRMKTMIDNYGFYLQNEGRLLGVMEVLIGSY